MELSRLQEYAELLIKQGIHVEKGEELWINTSIDQPEFVRMLVEEAYKAGAKKVRVRFSDDKIAKYTYQYMSASNLSKVPNYTIAEYKYMVKHLPSMLHVRSDDPDAFKDIPQRKLATVSMKTSKKIKPYRNQMDGKYKWCIAGVPSKAWAKKVFPGVDENEAEEKLWNAILDACRVDGNAVKNWEIHNKTLLNHKKLLDSLDLQYLEYSASNGTKLKVELNKGCHWGAGLEETSDGRWFNPNIPTEEVFTTPKAGSVEGIVYSSRPLSYQGQVIDEFWVKFEGGRVVAVGAKKNQKQLEQMVKMDEGAGMLGECALVPYDSPIRKSGLLFFETLYDENAACHLALGHGFKELLEGGAELTTEQAKERGCNDSMIHVDFMIGTKDLKVIGTSFNGKKTVLFENGNWAI